MIRQARVFSSFWMGGFESACHINGKGERLDMIAATQHDRFVDEDYRNLAQMGLCVARETIRWHLVDRGAAFDFRSMDPMIAAARRHGVQVLWDLCHYGFPDGIDIYSAEFVNRFAGFCRAAARHLRESSDEVPFFTPMNEISFFAWAAGEVGWFYPYSRGRGGDVKRQLVRATIAGIEAIRDVDPRARILTVEPLINVVPPAGHPEYAAEAAAYRNSQYEAWDLLSGALEPALGGRADYLDVIGVNFYHDNQWEQPGGRKIAWHIHPRDPRWLPFHRLLREAYDRYRRPVFIAETSHVGSGRAEWIREMTDEMCLAIEDGVPLEGVCLYPVVDRFEWEDPAHWHNSGLWDFVKDEAGNYRRVLNEEYAAEVRRSQARIARYERAGAAVPAD